MGLIAFGLFIAVAIGLCLTWLYTENYSSSLLTANISRTNPYEGANGAIRINTVVNTGLTDHPYLISFGYATLQLIWMVSDQNVRVCVNDTHSGSPLITVNLVAGVPYVWTNDAYFANPFGTTNVTEFYITNTTGINASIQGEVVY